MTRVCSITVAYFGALYNQPPGAVAKLKVRETAAQFVLERREDVIEIEYAKPTWKPQIGGKFPMRWSKRTMRRIGVPRRALSSGRGWEVVGWERR